ncbi:MAG: HD-GYP domain-containing protein [candidate division Zixibacteria bacterium]|nr:HD-GYP domain-containing protein [candidate division Zixibacteria bacterium]
MPIHLDCIRVDSVLDFNLYLKINGNLVLYRSADLPFTDRTRQKLLENRVDRLYIRSSMKQNYQKYIEQNLEKIMTDPQIRDEKKANILYEASTGLVKDVFSNPTYGENIQRSQALVENTVSYILKGREAFLNLLTITSFDYYTYTHSVNVCTFSIALAQQLGFNDEQFLHELGVGALLHDVGKSKISERILNKRSSLSPYEFEIMKKHPQWGVEILEESNLLSATTYFPVLQHHERGDRSGYPAALNLSEMHLYSQIVAITDTFDAMTSERVYQKAVDTYPALKIMFSLKGSYDDRMLRMFAELMGPSGLSNY